tara:strand:+ start:121 stop:624 length:504 start_codon:yes stop_codon:yes gene_type:complete
MSWFDVVVKMTPMQQQLKQIARKQGLDTFGDKTMIIRINEKQGDDFELTLRAKTSGESRRSAYGFKFRNGELYMAEGPFLVYTASSGKDLYEEFENAINELMDSYRDKNPMPKPEPPKYTEASAFYPIGSGGRPKGSGPKKSRRKYMDRYRESDRELQRRLNEKYKE